jgi:hypothetical protein
MSKIVLYMRSVNLVLSACIIIFSVFTSTYSYGQTDEKGRVILPPRVSNNDEKGPVNSLRSLEALKSLGNVWLVKECCGWTGTWTRRAGTNTFDAKWKHTNGTVVTDEITLIGWNTVTNEVVLSRKSINGGSYKAIYSAASKTLTNGTATWYPAGQSWSAAIQK